MNNDSIQDSQGIQIRLGQLSDVPQIIEIRKRTFSHFAPSSYTPKEVETLINDMKPSELEEMIKNKSLFVAEDNYGVVGCGGWLGDAVRHMYVSPEKTKKGIGSALLRFLGHDYRNRTGNSVIKAGVILYARPFYEKNGYEFLKIDTDWDGSKFNRMEKKMDTITPEVRAFLLEAARTGKIATVRADGRPHIVPIWFDLDDDNTVYFNTGESTVKAKNMRRDPRISLCIDDERPPYAFAVLEGTVTFVDDDAAKLRWATSIAGRYMGADNAEAYGKRNAVEGELLVRFTATHVLFQKDVAS